jgi:hypothetical protein
MIDREIKLCKQVSEMTNKYENESDRHDTTEIVLKVALRTKTTTCRCIRLRCFANVKIK